jgi:hypothetical protein
MRILAAVSEPISVLLLQAAIGDQLADDVEVVVIAPALHMSALRFWMSDADEAIATAERVERASVASLATAGVQAVGDVGESEIQAAVRDALATFPADRIVLFIHSGDAGR